MAKDKDNVIDLDKKIKDKQVKESLDEELDFLGDIDESLFTDNKLLHDLNKEAAFIRDMGGKPRVMREFPNPLTNKPKIVFQNPDSLITDFSNKFVPVGKRTLALGKCWLAWEGRRQYETVFFDPTKPKEYNKCFNLWDGLDIKPKKGKWDLLRQHMLEILSNNDIDKFDYLIHWLAWCVQNPGERAEVALAFKGRQGSGKGVVFRLFVEIFGQFGKQISDMTHLTGTFNEHLGHCCFLYADESYIPDEAMGAFKRLITEPTLSIRPLYMPLTEVKNCLHVVLTTNEDLIAFSKEDSRRLYINEVDNKYADSLDPEQQEIKEKYFNALYKEIDKGGREAMLHDLLEMKLSNWSPRQKVPKTMETRNQIEKSDSLQEKMILSLLEDGIFPGICVDGEHHTKLSNIRELMEKTIPRAKNISDKSLADACKKFGAIKRKKQSDIYWVFPSLKEMREDYCKRRGFKIQERFDPTDNWITKKQTAY